MTTQQKEDEKPMKKKRTKKDRLNDQQRIWEAKGGLKYDPRRISTL